MKKIIHKAGTRGTADYGWLKPQYSFSFAGYYNPDRVHFGLLRVLNNDWVAPGGGFDTHPHDNMEITTIPLTGSLEHRDSMGSTSVIVPGEVQVMSAGTGITHSEYNYSDTEPLTLLQIWVFPKLKDIEPRYDQKAFDLNHRKNKLITVIAPDPSEKTLWLNQDVWFSLGRFDAPSEFDYTLNHDAHGVYVFMISGTAVVEGDQLEEKDAIGIWETPKVHFKTPGSSYILVIEVPMH
jgi:quercetin 2,3-dioxygenase